VSFVFRVTINRFSLRSCAASGVTKNVNKQIVLLLQDRGAIPSATLRFRGFSSRSKCRVATCSQGNYEGKESEISSQNTNVPGKFVDLSKHVICEVKSSFFRLFLIA
jgi:hypothetical protein